MKSEKTTIRHAMTDYESAVFNRMSNHVFLQISVQVCHHVEDQVSGRLMFTLVYPQFLGERHTITYPLLTQVRQSLVDYV